MYPMYHNDFRNKILAGVMALALLSMAAGGLLLWKNRRGTPGEPVGLYHRLLCDGLALERQYIRQDAKDYPRQVLVVDLSGSILTEEEKTEVLERIEADWPMLEVVDYPAESSDQTFHGRFDDIIKTGGFRVGPYEVEHVLAEHPAVLECSVIGVPDPLRGQAIKAIVQPAPGYAPCRELEAELRDFCNQRLAEYKWVRLVELVEEMPKTISGKVQKGLQRRE